jgi:hypothetical protein
LIRLALCSYLLAPLRNDPALLKMEISELIQQPTQLRSITTATGLWRPTLFIQLIFLLSLEVAAEVVMQAAAVALVATLLPLNQWCLAPLTQ